MRNCLWLFLLTCSVAALAEDKPNALVKTEPMRREITVSGLQGYGTLFSDPRLTLNVSQPRSGRVGSLDVSAGQTVRRGHVLFEFETDPNAANGYLQAEAALEMARSGFESMSRLYARQLATNAQLASAKKALKDAKGAFDAQKRLGSGMAREVVKAPFDAVVAGIYASPGDRIQAGKSVLQLARRDGLRARIGIQPEDALKVRPGMKVVLFPVFGKPRKLMGEVSEVNGMIDPQTRLVDVIVDVGGKEAAGLVPGMKVRGTIEIPGASEWSVPRSAVLADGNGAYIFQSDKGFARRVYVTATENGEMTAIRGRFDPRLPVVVLGNYELQDGMKLRENR